MASGRPVLAYGAGGALETVVDGVTGRFYREQTSDSLAQLVISTDYGAFDPTKLRAHALNFSPEAFRENIRREVAQVVAEHKPGVSKVPEPS